MRKVYFWGGMAASEALNRILMPSTHFVKDFQRLDKKIITMVTKFCQQRDKKLSQARQSLDKPAIAALHS
jgi:hypothetical protein